MAITAIRSAELELERLSLQFNSISGDYEPVFQPQRQCESLMDRTNAQPGTRGGFMISRRGAQSSTSQRSRHREATSREGSAVEQFLVQQLLSAALPEIRALIKEVIADEVNQPLIVDYEEAGRMIGTTYEGVRKLVRNGKLQAVSRSGRNRGIAVAELKDYVRRCRLLDSCDSALSQ